MTMNKKSYSILAVAVAGSMGLAACGGGSSDNKSGGSGAEGSGGTLYYLTKRPAEHLDPQRMYIGRDLSNLGRLTYRSLVQFPVTEDKAKADKPVADLATDTGKMSDGGKTWKFTIKDGVKWEDGKDITCADFKYGLSRTFATDVITGGPNYAIGFLDIPKKGDAPAYNGPYKKEGQAEFDKAVTCEGKTITYKFNKAWPDFNLAVASLRAFDPYRKDKDKGDKSNYAIFSNGPYKLQGTWKKGTGGTFVRNEHYDAKTDGVRKALPDKIEFKEGLTNEIINQRLIADGGKDKSAITDRAIPPSMYGQIKGDSQKRSVNVESPYVDYLVPNFNKMKNLKVRQALLAATNQDAWITAGGGDKAYAPSYSIINPALTTAYAKNPAFTDVPKGNIEKAKKLLEGVPASEKNIKFTYSGGTPTADKQAGAMKDNWEKAGFKVTLNGLTDTYYDVIQNPKADGDVFWGGWGSDWPSASTVIPALFDSRLNLTEKSNGQDYGNYKSDEVNKMIDEAAKKTSVDEAGEVYKQIDKKLGEDVAYIPLEIQKFYYLRGSKVTNYINNPATSMYPDLGAVGVSK
ncbi:ABC transporter substrate-binding protein [Dermacoccus sp. PAMC28757]|nr:ABC transporter substrate-binding protein [Dermacoccus barathri]QNK54243.1 ABC transporter substrate-binding protein [Dermacoccus sp. PAMC28757]